MDKAIEKAIIETANPALAPGKSKPANAAANRKIPFLQDNAPAGDAPQSKPLKDVLYEQITSVIGGDNPNQFFSMSLPGTLLDAAQYTYNVDGNQPKPAEVEANESKLANKLFDPCKIGAADSGRLLQNQYKTALEMLTPRLNGKLFDAKTKLRRVLMTPYPYNFGDGSKDVLTIEQVFYRLYEEYVSEKLAWAKEQLAKKNALAAKYPDNTAIDYAERDNEYLNWYETVAEARTLAVAEKFGKVLNVFSPGDMDVIAAILNSGAGREVAQASQALDNVQKMNPDGSYVYPVTLYPQNWFNLLDTSFTTIDLLQSPAALSQRLAVLSGQRSSISNNINALMAMIPDEKTVTDFKEAKDKAETDSAAAVAKLSADGVKVTGDILNQALDIMNAGGITGKDAGTNEKGASLLSRVIGGITPDMVNKLIDDTAELQTDRQNVIKTAQAATDAALNYFTAKNLTQLKAMLIPLKTQLADVEAKITETQQNLNIVLATQQNADKIKDASAVAPNKIPDNFTQIIIESDMSAVTNSSSSSGSSSQSSFDVSFFFGGYSSSHSRSEAVSNSSSNSKSTSIQIGMSVAKVTIEREWFNPGVFALSGDMYNTTSEKISPSTQQLNKALSQVAASDDKFPEQRLALMNSCVFPCYPVAFVIARDVTIKFLSQSSVETAFAHSVEEHSASGGGFFIFGGSRSSSSRSSQSASSATSTSTSVTVRFTNPQILGYYLEAVAPDDSTAIGDASTNSDADFISVFEFIEKFQKMLDDYNKTYNKSALSI